MKAEKCREFIVSEFNFMGIDLDLELIAELDHLEAKAQELDRREKGVAVIDKGVDYECPHCGGINGYKPDYCMDCGTKLIWESEAGDE